MELWALRPLDPLCNTLELEGKLTWPPGAVDSEFLEEWLSRVYANCAFRRSGDGEPGRRLVYLIERDGSSLAEFEFYIPTNADIEAAQRFVLADPTFELAARRHSLRWWPAAGFLEEPTDAYQTCKCPLWSAIEATLAKAGHSQDEVARMTAPELMALVTRGLDDSSGPKAFDRAKRAALSCIASTERTKTEVVRYWNEITAGREAAGEFPGNLADDLTMLLEIYETAFCALSPEVLEGIQVACAGANNLPGVRAGTRAYASFHEAAIGELYELFPVDCLTEISARTFGDDEPPYYRESRSASGHGWWMRRLFELLRDFDGSSGCDYLQRIVTHMAAQPANWGALRAGVEREWVIVKAALGKDDLRQQPAVGDSGERWYREEGWYFCEGKYAFNGRVFEIRGKLWKLLKAFAEARRPLNRQDLARLVWDDFPRKGDTPEDGTMDTTITHLRHWLRNDLKLPRQFNPILLCDRGGRAAWQLNPDIAKEARPKAI